MDVVAAQCIPMRLSRPTTTAAVAGAVVRIGPVTVALLLSPPSSTRIALEGKVV
ncbi:hypothetical protein ACFVAV_30875 [Nocardia sp. NPDC057663]|uniref:hypothetical protein n=1 Tax=Nocardia sp. NPDC057663 TaxID=3346201 RepID=UPI00366E5507